MKKIQIIENEELQKYADFENHEVWLLNRTNNDKLDERIINVSEVTDSMFSSTYKFPMLFTEILKRYPTIEEYEDVEVPQVDIQGNPILDNNNLPILIKEKRLAKSEMGFEYEVLTKNKLNFEIRNYVCDEKSIKVIKD